MVWFSKSCCKNHKKDKKNLHEEDTMISRILFNHKFVLKRSINLLKSNKLNFEIDYYFIRTDKYN